MARRRDGGVLVIGLGRFGSAVAETLAEMGREVLGVDTDADRVQRYSGILTHVVQADATDEGALKQLGVQDLRRAVVGIGTDIEASILTTAALVDLKVPQIWAKAVTMAHGRILRRVGANEVVYPEHDMGERLAHIVAGRMIDYIELDDNFALVQTRPPRELVGKTLSEAEVRRRYGITVVCIKSATKPFTYATPDTMVRTDDVLVVAGETKFAEAFADLD